MDKVHYTALIICYFDVPPGEEELPQVHGVGRTDSFLYSPTIRYESLKKKLPKIKIRMYVQT